MIAAAVVSVALLAAPDADPAPLLRVAWASQYEWKEDGVRNVLLEFRYAATWKGENETSGRWEGTGHVVVVGAEIKQRHYPAAEETVRAQLDEHLDWIVARFARRPFEEEFKDLKLAGPEASTGSIVKVTAGSRVFLLDHDRLVGEERNVGTEARPFLARVDFTDGALGNGYAILGETCSYTRNTERHAWKRTLAPRKDAEFPQPESYRYQREERGNDLELEIAITGVTRDLEDPIGLDPAARALLAAAWGKRFVLPGDLQFESEFQRKIDRTLDKAGWSSLVKGTVTVNGPQVTVALDERLFRNPRWKDQVTKSCQEHFDWYFGMLRDVAFDEEFAGCGFRRDESNPQVVQVFGYAKALAFVLDDEGRLAGHRENSTDPDAWWTYKLKGKGEGAPIERMSRTVAGDTHTLRFTYGRTKRVTIPKTFQCLVTPEYGIASYKLK